MRIDIESISRFVSSCGFCCSSYRIHWRPSASGTHSSTRRRWKSDEKKRCARHSRLGAAALIASHNFLGALVAFLLLTGHNPVDAYYRGAPRLNICDYYAAIHKLHEHPECGDPSRYGAANTETKSASFETGSSAAGSSATTIELSVEKSELPSCSTHAALVQCTSEAEECLESGQICKQLDGSSCCQPPSQGIPVSHINAKAGKCPAPTGIVAIQEAGTSGVHNNNNNNSRLSTASNANGGCWLDANCPGIQKCCLEPNPVSKTAKRICRDPLGISSESVCNLPLVVGTCTAPTTRYYFDSSMGKCKPFQYSGCGSNANNFQTMSSCQATCGYLGVQGTPSCPSDANIDLNCLLPHVDACKTDSDCLGRKNTVQPSCCMTKCGYRICYLY